jgi:hypothetical protein
MQISYVVAYPSWFQQVLCYCVCYIDVGGLSVCTRLLFDEIIVWLTYVLA